MRFLNGDAEVSKYVGGNVQDFMAQLSRDILQSNQPVDAARSYLTQLLQYLIAKKDAARVRWLQAKSVIGGKKVYQRLPKGPGAYMAPAYIFDSAGWITGYRTDAIKNPPASEYVPALDEYNRARALEDAYQFRIQAVQAILGMLGSPGARDLLQNEASRTRSSYADFWTVTEDVLNPVTLSPIVTINPITKNSETSAPLSPETVKDSGGEYAFTPQRGGLADISLPPVFFVSRADATAPPPAQKSSVPLILMAAAGAYLAFK